LIVIEGCDGSGKSTLVKSLSEDLDLPSYHKARPGTAEEVESRMNEVIAYSDGPAIWDRVPIISEQIYGPVLRGVNVIAHKADALMNLFLARGPLIIFCRPPTPVMMSHKLEQKAHDTDKHIASVAANYHKLIDAYDSLMGDLRIRSDGRAQFKLYDYTQPLAYERIKGYCIRYLMEN